MQRNIYTKHMIHVARQAKVAGRREVAYTCKKKVQITLLSELRSLVLALTCFLCFLSLCVDQVDLSIVESDFKSGGSLLMQEGGMMSLPCNIQGRPRPSIVWHKVYIQILQVSHWQSWALSVFFNFFNNKK